MNRYPKSLEESWDSWKEIMRRKLEDLDYLARQIFQDMKVEKIPDDRIREFMSRKFAELWNEVAEEQESKHRKERKGAWAV